MNLRKWAKTNGRDEDAVMAVARELGFNSAAWNSTIDETEDALLREHFAKLDADAAPQGPPDTDTPEVPAPAAEATVDDAPPPAPDDKPSRRQPESSEVGLVDAARKVLSDGVPRIFRDVARAMMAEGWKPEEGSLPADQVRAAVRRHCVERGDKSVFVLGNDDAVRI